MKTLYALFMIGLVLTIPIFVAADSGTLTNLSYSGADGVPKVVGESDSLNISVLAELRDVEDQPTELNENNLRVVLNGFEEPFTRCTDTGNRVYRCSYQGDDKDFSSGRQQLEVKLYDNYFVRMAYLSDYVYVDTKPPVATKLTLPSKINGPFTLAYTIQDESCTGCTGFCAGLSHIDVTVNGTVRTTISNLSGCSVSKTETLTVEGLDLEEGSLELCFVMYDMLGHSATTCKTVRADYTAPTVTDNQLTLQGMDGRPLSYAGLLPVSATVNLTLDETRDNIVSVVGDFSSLNVPDPDLYRGMSPDSCTGDLPVTCLWDVSVDGVDGAAAVTVNVTDASDNNNSFTKTFNLLRDATGPVVTDITSGKTDNNTYYLRPSGNNITVEITEAQSGVAEVWLDLHGVNPALSEIKSQNCSNVGGLWECVWPDVDVSGRSHGSTAMVRVTRLFDKVQNGWDQSASLKTRSFVFDSNPPKFVNMTLRPLGSDLGILMEGDIASITAYIVENGSGLAPQDVYADLSGFDKSINWTPAQSCAMVNGSLWHCEWQYAGNLTGGKDVTVKAVAVDIAGNERTSTQDSVSAKAYVARVKDQKVDFWQESAVTYDVDKLNRNFLWMSSQGTYIRAGVQLVAKTPAYVHAMDIVECKGTLIIPNKDKVYEDFALKGQYYYPDKQRSDKWLLINIPHMDKNNVANATAVEIVCSGEIVQGRSSRSEVYTPNEVFNATLSIGLTEAMFSQPDMAQLDKINEKKSELKQINSLIKMIEWWVKLAQPFCTLINLVRQTLAGICVIYNGMIAVTMGTWKAEADQCYLNFDTLQNLWYGEKNERMSSWGSTKSLKSIGFWCDTVLCEDCANLWNNKILNTKYFSLQEYADKLTFIDAMKKQPTSASGQAKDSDLFPTMTPQERAQGIGTYRPTVSVDPRQSLVVAVVCWPPCLTGILSKLQVYKQIIITYNVCMNTAAVRGTDTSECDSYYSSQVCQQILGEFWYIIDNFIKDYISKMIVYFLEEKALHLSECPPDVCNLNTGCQTRCYRAQMYRIAGYFLQVMQVEQNLEAIMDHQYFQGTDKEKTDSAQSKVNSELNK
jgi:hypothetical protein